MNKLDESKIKILRDGEDPPKGWKDIKVQVNTPLFCKVTGQGGGNLAIDRFDKIFIEGEVMDIFCKLALPIFPKAKPRRSKEFMFAYDRKLYKSMELMHKHMTLAPGAGSFANDQCLFAMKFLQNFFKLNSIDEVRMLMGYWDNRNPKNPLEVAELVTTFTRRAKQ